MEETTIYKTLESNCSPLLDVRYYIETLFENPENEWFSPTNLDKESYSICHFLSETNLIQMKRTPLWHNAGFRGVKIEFRYNKNLKY